MEFIIKQDRGPVNTNKICTCFNESCQQELITI
jgi:hypothetical protein